MLQRVTIAYFRLINGNTFPQSEDVLVDAPDGDTAALLARQEHASRLLASGALCETDDHGGQKIRAAVMGIEPATAADIARLRPEPVPEIEDDMPDGGPMMGVVAGGNAVVLQEQTIRLGARTGSPAPQVTIHSDSAPVLKPKNKGGRPKGSRNRAKADAAA